MKARTEQEALLFIEPLIPLLESGVSLFHACNVSEIPEKSVRRYMEKYPSIDSKLRSAKSRVIADAANTIGRAAKTEWKPALEVLKRKDKKEWGDNVDITSGQEKITPILGGLSVKEESQP